jgi:hypothetical protein
MRQSQFTVRGLDARVEKEIRSLAKRERISLNKAAARLLEKGAGIAEHPDDRIGASLDHLIGTWSEKQAAEVLETISACEQVDSGFWR